MISKQVVKQLPQRALTKGVVYPMVKKVASYLGVQMTKKTFAQGLAKTVPIVGAAVSGTVTLASYLPMANKLKNHLEMQQLTNPNNGTTYDFDI